MITLAFLSMHSKHLIKKVLENLISYNLSLPIIIIENSRDFSLKNEINEKYGNQVTVYIPDENLGFSAGMNKAVELSKTQFVFLNPADIFLSKVCLEGLMECVKVFKDFAILAPTYEDETTYRNYDVNIYSRKNEIKKNFKILEKYNLKEVDMIDGTLLINKSQLGTKYLMDENFFIYFETWDMCWNFKRKNKKMYVIDNLKFKHLGGQSHHNDYDFQANLSRNWHYNWSKFYYYKKNIGYVYAYKKTIPLLVKMILKLIISNFKSKKKDIKLIKAEISGLLNSYLGKPSYYRPYIKE